MRLRFPRALAVYQRITTPLLARDHAELSKWARKGPEIVARTGMHGIRFERDGIWVDDGAGFLWAYTPGVFMSALGAEAGVRYEKREIELLAERLPPGGTLVDVGANMGLYSVQLARLVEGLTVLAFEPVGETYRVLQRNIVKNRVEERVRAWQLALTERPGTVRLTSRLHVGNFVVPAGEAAAAGVTEEVKARPLDDVLREQGLRVDAIKCDVEGAELDVVRGARATLERDRPLLLLEIDERWASRYGHSGTKLVGFLQELGYSYQRIVGDELHAPSGSLSADLAEGRNFLFTSR